VQANSALLREVHAAREIGIEKSTTPCQRDCVTVGGDRNNNSLLALERAGSKTLVERLTASFVKLPSSMDTYVIEGRHFSETTTEEISVLPRGGNQSMQTFSTGRRYGVVAQSFHWLTVVLIACAYLLSPGGTEMRVYSPTGVFDRTLHESLGILIFGLVLLRLIWRFFDQAQGALPMARWMGFAARLVHVALYALMIAVPTTAILGAWYEGHPITILGLGDIAPIMTKSHALGAIIADLHTTLGNLIIWIAGLHAAAALFHHFYLKDSILSSMLPWRE
jgi:cytochrome b561